MIGFRNGMETEERMRTATVDHKVCKSLGGENIAENYVICCARCNQLKGMVPFEVFKTFASFVLIPYPDLPLNILRHSLQDYTMLLLESVVHNRKAMRNASSVTLLKLSDSIKLYEKGRK
jgi:hypothetical protein